MNKYYNFFEEKLDYLKKEGNYRIFADLEKLANNFPKALNYKTDKVSEVTVWCSNDYLGMSQNRIVLDSMIEALNKVGAGSGGTRNISDKSLSRTSRKRVMLSSSKRISTSFNSGYLANQATLNSRETITNCAFFLMKNHASMIQGIKNANTKKLFLNITILKI